MQTNLLGTYNKRNAVEHLVILFVHPDQLLTRQVKTPDDLGETVVYLGELIVRLGREPVRLSKVLVRLSKVLVRLGGVLVHLRSKVVELEGWAGWVLSAHKRSRGLAWNANHN